MPPPSVAAENRRQVKSDNVIEKSLKCSLQQICAAGYAYLLSKCNTDKHDYYVFTVEPILKGGNVFHKMWIQIHNRYSIDLTKETKTPFWHHV